MLPLRIVEIHTWERTVNFKLVLKRITYLQPHCICRSVFSEGEAGFNRIPDTASSQSHNLRLPHFIGASESSVTH